MNESSIDSNPTPQLNFPPNHSPAPWPALLIITLQALVSDCVQQTKKDTTVIPASDNLDSK